MLCILLWKSPGLGLLN